MQENTAQLASATKPDVVSAQSLGEFRTRVGFNPSNTDSITRTKQKVADLIDGCLTGESDDPELKRLFSIAQTKYEEACMFHIKALTFFMKGN